MPGLLFAFFLSLSGITGTNLSSAAPLQGEPAKVTAQGIHSELKVIPGGQTIGVKVKSAGVLVVGHHLIEVSEKSKLSPGEVSGLVPGDLMISMNGEKLDELSKVAKLVDRAGKANNPLTIVFKRGGKEHTAKLKPAYDIHDKVWRLGLYIRDSAAGVGTLTFYAPEQGVYGALGHVITDMNTGTPIVVGSGHIVQSSVTSISKSQDGDPGEKRAHF